MHGDDPKLATVSASGAARQWVEALPAGTWFRSAAVPGPGHVVRNVLSRLMAASQPIIGRAAQGIYWRQPPPADRAAYGQMPLSTHLVDSVLAPPGSGYAEHCASSWVGWSRQMPHRTTIAVPYRNLTPPSLSGRTPVRFVERPNKRRRSLNWNEATLLEAARSSGPADYSDWDHAMWYLTEATGWMKQGEPIRKDMLLWAADTEAPSGKWPAGQGDKSFDAVMARLARDLPDLVETP